MHQPPETFVSMMVGRCVWAPPETSRGGGGLGAGWVPEMLRRLDSISRIYSRVDESVRFERSPSQQLTDQMGFTPFPHEDVGRLIRDSNEGYLFSSDYPTSKAARPIGKFESVLKDSSNEAKTKFYSETSFDFAVRVA